MRLAYRMKTQASGWVRYSLSVCLAFHAAKILQNFDSASVPKKLFACAIIQHNHFLSLPRQNEIIIYKNQIILQV